MPPLESLRSKTYALLVLMILSSSVGNVLLSKGMKEVGEVREWAWLPLATTFIKTFSSATIWLGIASLLLFFVFYLLLLSWADYSYVLPASASGYAVVALLGYLVLGEVITPLRWLGVLLICVGVALVSRTPPRTTFEE